MWKQDKMCDKEGIYSFKNGNEYRGHFCPSNLAMYGVFEGRGTFKIVEVCIYSGQFKSGMICGQGRVDFINSNKSFEGIWNPVSLESFEQMMRLQI